MCEKERPLGFVKVQGNKKWLLLLLLLLFLLLLAWICACPPWYFLAPQKSTHKTLSLSLSLSLFTWVLALEPSPRLTHISRPKTMDSCINSLNTYLTISTHHHHHYYQLSTLKVFIFHISFYILKLFFFIQNFFIYFF